MTRPSATALALRYYGFAALCLLLLVPGASAAEAQLGGRLRVRVAPVAEAVLAERRTTTGVLRAWRTATVAAEVAGRVVQRRAEPGFLAEAGEVLLRTDSRRVQAALRGAQAALARQEVDLAKAQQDLARAERLFGKGAISEDRVDDQRFTLERAQAQVEEASAALEEAQRQADEITIRAPFTGKVEAVYAQPGDYVHLGTPIALLSDFSRARVITGISGMDISRIRPGDEAEVVLTDLGGLRLSATVTSVGSIKEVQGGTYPVELIIEGPGVQRLRDGLVATVAWRSDSQGAQPSVPVSAVLRRDGQLLVYAVSEGVVTERPIVVGRSDGDRTVIYEGVALGEQVVIEGHFALTDGALVEIDQVLGAGDLP